MFRSWSLKGFKSIYDQTHFEILPLTIFTGANSSGKSSVIQSILLSAQTLQNNVPTRPLILNGQIIRLGNFYDILSYRHQEESITIGFELESATDFRQRHQLYSLEEDKDIRTKNIISCSYKFSVKDKSEVSALQPLITESIISVYDVTRQKKISELGIIRTPMSIEEKMKKYNIENINERSSKSLEFDIKSTDRNSNKEEGSFRTRYDKLPVEELFIGAELLHFIPQNIISRVNKYEVSAIRFLEFLKYPMYESLPKEINQITNENFLQKLEGKLSNLLNDTDKVKSIPRIKKLKKHLINFRENNDFDEFKNLIQTMPSPLKIEWAEYIESNQSDFLKQLTSKLDPKYALISRGRRRMDSEFVEEIVNYFNNKVKYLGPLRDEPKPIYPNSGALDSKDVGYRGEYTAAVLELHKETIITYMSPEDLEADEYNKKEGKLIDAVLEWLKYMGISRNVRTYDRGKLGHELQVQLSEEGKYHDLTNVGVGVSQVLPILVMSLLADSDSTIIFEQPELHLHPKVQTRLADFFVTMTKLKKQCILETHSEYLINRLRYKAVSSSKDNIKKDVVIYFVEQEEGKSKYRPIHINEYGVIEEWPNGFFDEHEKTSAAILKAARNKSRGI